jgi:hypothetical protein
MDNISNDWFAHWMPGRQRMGAQKKTTAKRPSF